MAVTVWLDDLRRLLTGRGLPPAYVERLAAELADHIEDSKEKNMRTEAEMCSQLGKPEQVAAAAVAAYRQRSFLGRHPTAAFLVFAISPVVPLFGLGFVVCASLTRVCAAIAASVGGQEVGTAVAIAWASFFGLLIVCCSILATLLYCELAERSCVSRRWMVVSWAVLAVWAVLWQCGLRSDMGRYATWFLSVALPIQFIVPLAVGWWFRRRHSRQTYPVTTFFALAVTPIVALAAVLSLVFLGLNLLQTQCGPLAAPLGITIDGHNWGAQTTIGTSVLILVALIVCVAPSGLLSLLYCKLAKRFNIRGMWALTPCLMLAMVAILPGYYERHMCSSEQLYLGYIEQLLQFVAPLTIGWWLLRRGRHREQPQLAA
jgi:hypothetical protein